MRYIVSLFILIFFNVGCNTIQKENKNGSYLTKEFTNDPIEIMNAIDDKFDNPDFYIYIRRSEPPYYLGDLITTEYLFVPIDYNRRNDILLGRYSNHWQLYQYVNYSYYDDFSLISVNYDDYLNYQFHKFHKSESKEYYERKDYIDIELDILLKYEDKVYYKFRNHEINSYNFSYFALAEFNNALFNLLYEFEFRRSLNRMRD